MMLSSTSKKMKNRQATGYVLVPLNAITRAFLSQFASLPSDGVLPPLHSLGATMKEKNNNKKRNPTDNPSTFFGVHATKKICRRVQEQRDCGSLLKKKSKPKSRPSPSSCACLRTKCTKNAKAMTTVAQVRGGRVQRDCGLLMKSKAMTVAQVRGSRVQRDCGSLRMKKTSKPKCGGRGVQRDCGSLIKKKRLTKPKSTFKVATARRDDFSVVDDDEDGGNVYFNGGDNDEDNGDSDDDEDDNDENGDYNDDDNDYNNNHDVDDDGDKDEDGDKDNNDCSIADDGDDDDDEDDDNNGDGGSIGDDNDQEDVGCDEDDSDDDSDDDTEGNESKLSNKGGRILSSRSFIDDEALEGGETSDEEEVDDESDNHHALDNKSDNVQPEEEEPTPAEVDIQVDCNSGEDGGESESGSEASQMENGGPQFASTASFITLSSTSNQDANSQLSLSTDDGWGVSDHPIVQAFPRPSIVTQTLPPYSYKASTAPMPVRDSIITYDLMDTRGDLGDLTTTEPFGCKGIVSLHSYVKQGCGLLWQNRSSCKLHYETDMEYWRTHTKPKARLLQIPHHIFFPDGGKVRKVVCTDDNAFVIVSSGTFYNFHDKVCFRDIICDSCILAKNTVPKQDEVRRNSGPSMGLASSQGTT
jgi:hypothetical protein